MVAAAAGLEIGLVATPFALGFRHGFDWDHLAALSDIAASQQSRRRSMMLATLYALGHAGVAFAIGAAVILASAHLPASVGEFMERLVGVTLVALGIFVIVSTVRQGQSTCMPSRGALLVAGFRRLQRRPPPRSSSSTSTTIRWGSTTTTSSSPSERLGEPLSSRGTATDTATSARSRTTRCRRTAGARLSAWE